MLLAKRALHGSVVAVLWVGLSSGRSEAAASCQYPNVTAKTNSKGELSVSASLSPGRELLVVVMPTSQELKLDRKTKRFKKENVTNGSFETLTKKDHEKQIKAAPAGPVTIHYQWMDDECETSESKHRSVTFPQPPGPDDFDFRLDAGTVVLFNGDSSITSRVETAAGMLLRVSEKNEVEADIRYSAFPAVATTKSPTPTPTPTPSARAGKATREAADPSKKYSNPSGSLAASVAFSYGWTNALAVRLGGGFRTLAGSSNVDGFSRAPAKGFIGLRLWFPPVDTSATAPYSRHRGFLEVDYSFDGFWRDVPVDTNVSGSLIETRSQFHRVVGIAEYSVVGSGKSQLILRGFVNAPLTSRGPSEVKFSALLSIDISTLFPVK
jgi:hypothetical protein